MSKTYIVSRNGGTVSKAPVNDNKLPIYANETALDADLANIPDNTLVATKGGHDDVINQMKKYIREQNVLSDYEAITISSDSNNPTVMRYDGILVISARGGAKEVYCNGKVLAGVTTGTPIDNTTSFLFNKDDELYVINPYADTIYVAYYKLRDYKGR